MKAIWNLPGGSADARRGRSAQLAEVAADEGDRLAGIGLGPDREIGLGAAQRDQVLQLGQEVARGRRVLRLGNEAAGEAGTIVDDDDVRIADPADRLVDAADVLGDSVDLGGGWAAGLGLELGQRGLDEAARVVDVVLEHRARRQACGKCALAVLASRLAGHGHGRQRLIEDEVIRLGPDAQRDPTGQQGRVHRGDRQRAHLGHEAGLAADLRQDLAFHAREQAEVALEVDEDAAQVVTGERGVGGLEPGIAGQGSARPAGDRRLDRIKGPGQDDRAIESVGGRRARTRRPARPGRRPGRSRGWHRLA